MGPVKGTPGEGTLYDKGPGQGPLIIGGGGVRHCVSGKAGRGPYRCQKRAGGGAAVPQLGPLAPLGPKLNFGKGPCHYVAKKCIVIRMGPGPTWPCP